MIACLTMDTLRPRSDAKCGSGEWLVPGLPASRTQRGQGRRRRSSARVFSVGIDCWELLRSEAAVLRGGHRTARWRKTQLGPGYIASGLGKLRGREAASLRRDRKPARVEAAVRHSQLHRRHERPVEATDALRPGCRGRDAGRTSTQALRTKRRTHSGPGVQREKGLSLQPLDEAANEGLITPSIGPRCVRRA